MVGFFSGRTFRQKIVREAKHDFCYTFCFCIPGTRLHTKKNDVNNPAFEGRQYILYVHIDGELCDGFSVNFEIGKIWHH